MPRVFIAINLPEEIKAKLAEMEKDIINSFEEGIGFKLGKWVKKDNLHLTLLFIGEIKQELAPQLCQAVNDAVSSCPSFELEFKKISYDQNRGTPRLIWAELNQNKELLFLNKILKDKLLDVKILKYVDSRPFKSHITLARVKQWVFKQIEPEERPNIERELNIKFKVSSIEIMESKLKRTGAEYSIIESIKLL